MLHIHSTVCTSQVGSSRPSSPSFLPFVPSSRPLATLTCITCINSRSARGARADLHAPKAPKSLAELEAEAAAEELMAKHREVRYFSVFLDLI